MKSNLFWHIVTCKDGLYMIKTSTRKNPTKCCWLRTVWYQSDMRRRNWLVRWNRSAPLHWQRCLERAGCLNGLGSSIVPRHLTCKCGDSSEKMSGPSTACGYTLCSASTSLVKTWECFSLHSSWMTKSTSLSAPQEDRQSFVCTPSRDSFGVLNGRAPLIMFHQLALPSRFQPTFDLQLVMQS